jgi:hypothetical protein
MSSFISGLMSVGKKLGGAAKDWGQGTKIGRAIDMTRNTLRMGQKSSNQAGGTDSDSSGAQSA